VASFALIRAAQLRLLTPLATPTLFLEYEDVLKRDDQRRASGLSISEVDRFLSALAVAIEPVDVHIRWRPQLKDAADEMVLEAAINGRADALVTFNVRDFADAAPKFGVRVVKPVELLLEIPR